MTRNPIARPLGATRPDLADRRGLAHPETGNEALLASLEESRADLMDAIELSSDAYALFDSDDRLIRCNNRYQE